MRYLALSFVLAFAALGIEKAWSQPTFVWGVNGHPFTAYPGVSLDQQVSYVEDLGMKSYRVNISDLSSVPALLDLVRIAKKSGIEILPVLTLGLDLDKEDAVSLHRKAYEFSKALVSIFKNDIRTWELGNELEVYAIIKACEMQDNGVQYNCAWGPAGGVGELEYYGPRWAKSSAVLKGLSEGARDADPTVRRAIGTAGWGHAGAFTRMKNDGIEWDISVWHMYGEDPEWAFKILAEYGKPIWVTEINHPQGSRDGEQAQADGLQKWMRRLLELSAPYKVEAAHIYELMDETYWAPDFEAIMGLVKLNSNGSGGWMPGEPKIAYGTVKSIVTGRAPAATASIDRKCDIKAHSDRERNIPNTVVYGYCLILGRIPDTVGMRSWIANIKTGQPAVDMLAAMTDSEEFQEKHKTLTMRDADYVGFVYRLLLAREPDTKGYDDYVAELGKGKINRGELARNLLQSSEFRLKYPAFF
ncbi:MAG: DUF4214 domain-containing protein [Hyphomicrobiales bacterium]|nr:DUF4214 domain-containing protein [Hyphomicrobiales bacterium]